MRQKDDVISRAAAINLLKKWSDGYSYIEVETNSAIKAFEALLSVQLEIIQCKDCKHRYTDDCSMRFVEWVEWDDDGYIEYDDVITDNTTDDGYCDKGERRTDD